MKHLASVFLACALLATSACDNGADGTLPSCATALEGTFDGDKTGIITALLSLQAVEGEPTGDGDLILQFVPDGEREIDGEAAVAGDGAVTSDSIALALTGTIDLDTCAGEGTWSFFGMDTGTWELSRR